VDRVPYEFWRDQGHLEATPGNIISDKRIRQKLNDLRDREGFDIVEVAFDPAFARDLAQTLQDDDGFTVVPIKQTCEMLNGAVMLLEKLVLSGGLRHGGHPILTWNAANVVTLADSGGRRRLDKRRSMERIDGMSALADALVRIFVAQGPQSVYSTRGLLVV
jgi:phage terminase large subunit-like protein